MVTTDWETVFEALEDRYRRRVLVRLLEHDSQQDDVVVPEDVHTGEKDLNSLRAELFHQHLPMLEASGFIQWDRDSNEVVAGPRFDDIRPVLELLHEEADDLPLSDWV